VPEVQKIARQPFTFGGVARFARAPVGRLFAVAAVFAVTSGIIVAWLVASAVAPVLDEAISKLPATGAIEGGKLVWPEQASRLLAANPFFSIEVDLDDAPMESAPVDFSVQIRTNELMVRSILGLGKVPYPPRNDVELNKTALMPVWGAWRAPLLLALIPGTAVMLMLLWALLGALYSVLPVAADAIFGRGIGLFPGWKLAVAAQLPGSLIMAFALALYSTGQISLVFVLVMFLAHFVPTFAYLLVSPFFVPAAEKLRKEKKENPFDREGKRKRKAKNPFS
jgi:hypothetical protein